MVFPIFKMSSTRKNIQALFIVSVFFSGCSLYGENTHTRDDPEEVDIFDIYIYELYGIGDRYDGSRIRIKGYLVLDGKFVLYLFPSCEAYRDGIFKSAFILEYSDEIHEIISNRMGRSTLHQRQVFVEGVYKHLGRRLYDPEVESIMDSAPGLIDASRIQPLSIRKFRCW